MNRNRKEAKRKAESLRVWTYDQALGALPFVTSVMGSLREHWTSAQAHDRRARQLAAGPGRPDRTRILAQADAAEQARAARDRFNEAADELHALDVFCTDPLRGEAVIPFIIGDQLAWFVFDLFAPDSLQSWRFHNDPLDRRRPIAEARALLAEVPRVA